MIGWLASHWLIVAAVVVGIAAAAAPALAWKLKAWILLAVVLWWGWTGHAAYDRLVLQTKADAALAAAQVATARAQASEAARVEEQSRAAAVNAAANAYEQGKRDAQAKGDRVVADLRAGNERLRSMWQGCAARSAAGVPGAAAAAGEPDADADLRATGAGRLVRAGAEADAWVLALQAACKVGR